MNKFWEWMEKKGYYHNGHTYSEALCDKELFENNKQMLIGYMFEYLFFHKKMIIDYGLCSGLDDLYDELREDIEMIRKDLDKR